jgi:serine/threonine-protein kinase RsbW
MSEPALQLAVPAEAENVIVIRQAVAGLGEALGLSSERVDDLKVVVTEACNNVVVHAYEGEPGPLVVTAAADAEAVVITVSDRGGGFRPRASQGDMSLGLGLPLIASLSDSFEIRGGAGEGTSMSVRFKLTAEDQPTKNGVQAEALEQKLAMAIAPGELVRPVLARVIGALAARAEFSVERLSDTVLLGDAVSAHQPGDFSRGLIEIAISDGDGTLSVRVGPLVEGGGERLLAEMDLPGDEGSLRALAGSMDVAAGKAPDGSAAEYLVIEVAS